VDWRKNLPAKEYPARPTSTVSSYWGSTVVGGAKHRAAGSRDFGYNYLDDDHKGNFQEPWYDQAAHSGSDTAPLDVEEIFAEEVGK
jgi:hypothetical protein